MEELASKLKSFFKLSNEDIHEYSENKIVLNINSKKTTIFINEEEIWIEEHGKGVEVFRKEDFYQNLKKSENTEYITSSMTGKILRICFKENDYVLANTTIVTIESMKMELNLSSKEDKKIEKIYFQEGDFVNKGDKILKFKL